MERWGDPVEISLRCRPIVLLFDHSLTDRFCSSSVVGRSSGGWLVAKFDHGFITHNRINRITKIMNNLKRVLFLAAFAHLALELSNNFLPVVYPLFITRLELNYTQVGVIAFVAGLGTSVVQPLFGYLTDRWGPIGLTALSVIWTGMIMGLVGFANHYMVLVLIVGLGALGSAAFHPPGAIIASASGGRRRGAAVSIFSVGGNIGSALSPILIGLSLAWLGMPGTAVLIPFALLGGLLLYTQLRRYYVPEQAGTASSSSAQVQGRSKNGWRTGLVLIVLIVMTRSWFQLSLATYLPVWLASQGRSLTAAGQVLSVLLVSISVGSLSGGVLSDWIGRWQVVGLSTLILAVAHWFLLSATGWGQVVFVSLIGVMIGATFPVTIVMAYELWPNRVGMAASLVMGLGWLPGGIGASATGQIADRFSLQVGLQSLLLAPLLGLLCVIAFMVLQRRHEREVSLEVA